MMGSTSKTTEQEIAVWTGLTKRDKQAIPPPKTIWHWYEKRKSINVPEQHRIQIAMYCLMDEAPTFYWLQGCQAQDIWEMLQNASSLRPSPLYLCNIVGVAAFLGKSFHKGMLEELGDYAQQLGPKHGKYPVAGPLVFFGSDSIQARTPKEHMLNEQLNQLDDELTEIAASVTEKSKRQPDARPRYRALALDCFLYAQHDNYVG